MRVIYLKNFITLVGNDDIIGFAEALMNPVH